MISKIQFSKKHTCGLLLLLPLMLSCLPCLSYAEDSYEPDNNLVKSNKIIIYNNYQFHDFHSPDDQDWVKFYAFEGENYNIRALNDGNSNIVLELYNETGDLLQEQDTPLESLADETLVFTECPADGIYFVKTRLYDNSTFTGNNAYRIKAYLPIGPSPGTIYGVARSAITGQPVGEAIVKTDRKRADITSAEDGSFRLLNHPPDAFELQAETENAYLFYRTEGQLPYDGAVEKNITMIPYSLSGAISILRLLAGETLPYSIEKAQDINGDDAIGHPEVIHILQKVAGLP